MSRHFPLESVHANARAAAIASEAAGRQGKFDAMSGKLFDNLSQWKAVSDPTALFETYATEIGLDLTQFRTDVADTALDARVTLDATEGAGLGVAGTPAFFLQGTRITNPATPDAFDQAVQGAIDALDKPFAINRATGDIILRDRSLLDAANSPVITLPVIVTDSSGKSESVNITINVTE